MFHARSVQFQIKNGKGQEFTRLFEQQVVPVLKSQKGFAQEMMLMNGDRGIGISLWQDRPSADAYNTKTYPEILQKLNSLLESTPRVENYEVPVSTLTK